jgi:hypothetical protein
LLNDTSNEFNISNFYANVISFEEDDFSLPIDSEGVFDEEETERRVQEWADVEKDLTPDGYDFATWEDITDEIPEIFFNRFCSTKHLEEDVRQFIKRPDILSLVKSLK